MKTLSEVIITPIETTLNGLRISTESITGLYKKFVGDYPKFYKMDPLCKLGFLGSDLLLKDKTADERENAAIVFFNKSGSLVADRNYEKTIENDNYFPSPALFVYTLANIVTGEIAIRNKIYGESSFYIMNDLNQQKIDEILESVYTTSNPPFIVTGWIEYTDDLNYFANIKLVTK
jgi:3-oxoacyl-[acyl-carrier-protein] synthase-1